MSNAPFNGKNVPRIIIAGTILALVGIGLFLLLWVWMGGMGVSNLPRLIVSLCIPPAMIAAIMGVYILVTRSNQ